MKGKFHWVSKDGKFGYFRHGNKIHRYPIKDNKTGIQASRKARTHASPPVS